VRNSQITFRDSVFEEAKHLPNIGLDRNPTTRGPAEIWLFA